MSRLSALLRPTLGRRVVLALLLAFALVWLMQLAVIFWQVTDRDGVDARLQARAGVLLASLPADADAGAARAAMRAAAAVLNESFYRKPPAGLFGNPRQQRTGPLLLRLTRAGSAVFASPEADGVAWDDACPAWSERAMLGRTYRIHCRRLGPWSLHVAEARPDPAWLAARISSEMLSYLALSFLVVLALLWLAVSRGLHPLRELSARIARKSPDDLAPLDFEPRYAELRPMAEALDRLLARLRGKLEHEAAFVHDAAHELRTPLAVIAAQGHALARAGGEPERQAAARRLELAVERASRVVGQLLSLAQMESRDAPARRRVDLVQVAAEEIALLAPAALAQGLEFALEAPDTLFAETDEMLVRTVLQNLLVNALRYVRTGQVEVRLSCRDRVLALSVADDGPGIPAAARERVFDRFYRVPGQDVAGSGLGLAIVRQAAARLGGQVRLDAGLRGRGCAFHLAWPLGR